MSTASLDSSLGRKILVALTGLGLLGFVLAHMLGNLQVFLGPEALNAYAENLKGLGPLLWVARIGLLALALTHVVLALRTAAQNRAARPVPYVASGRVQSTPGARSMTLTGLMILAFVLYHLAHFTWGATHPEHFALRDGEGRPDVYSMVVLGFQQPGITGLYCVAMLLLGLHLSHGVASTCQTLGLNSPVWAPRIRSAGYGITALIVLGNLSIPLAVLLGLVRTPGAAP
ncbi:MAG: succinate dehydrogenase cytochrome b subunit [Planctomycetota bacterium]